MREVININNDWKFIKEDVGYSGALDNKGENLNLPHTWNGVDGQDGGNNYFRGVCWYTRALKKPVFKQGEQIYLEFKGVNSSAKVYFNSSLIGKHDGGYSTFRLNITDILKDDNIIAVSVDNSKNDTVYPQTADFTFYGGIYRDVNIIKVSKNHFSLDFFGGSGLKVTPSIKDDVGNVLVQSYVTGKGQVKITILDDKAKVVAIATSTLNSTDPIRLSVEEVRLWNGVKDPYLYTVNASLIVDGIIQDEVVTKIGFRSFYVDPEQGFFLNGKKYPLRGVCRHQDRPRIGNALQKAHHEEDIKIICEVGANTIRLAHYQHDDYFYDLCDKYGLVVWAEIPYISKHMNNADDNATSQMQELIYQQYNHASIVCWGLSNEITMHSADNDRYDFHIKLNALCHKIDPTRLTAIACYMPCRIANKLNRIPDLVSYNLYFGWYFPIVGLSGYKLDSYHRKYPTSPIGLAEYGAEAMPNIHSQKPRRGDNTEEYQVIFHENMLNIINKRDYIWATHLWNMFDFAADARNQGGEPGMNHKGLVTFDRQTKKDSFYLYKAYWSSQPFVHICGKRFVNRTGSVAKIKVYSNQKCVELYNNGQYVDTLSRDKIFVFEVELSQTNNITVKSGELSDTAIINKVSKKDSSYRLKKIKNKSWEK